MSPLSYLLGSFYERQEARGVAFIGSARLAVTLGRPVTSFVSLLGDGFTQLHLEQDWLSVYASYFGGGKFLVAQFDFQEEYSPPIRPWLAFVHVSALVQRYFDDPEAFPGDPTSEVPAVRPDPLGPRPRVLHASVAREEPPSCR